MNLFSPNYSRNIYFLNVMLRIIIMKIRAFYFVNLYNTCISSRSNTRLIFPFYICVFLHVVQKYTKKIHRCKAGFRYLCLMNFLNTNQNKQESEHLKIFNWCRFKIKNFIIFNLKIHKWLRTN